MPVMSDLYPRDRIKRAIAQFDQQLYSADKIDNGEYRRSEMDKAKYNLGIWKQRLADHDAALSPKDREIARISDEIECLETKPEKLDWIEQYLKGPIEVDGVRAWLGHLYVEMTDPS